MDTEIEGMLLMFTFTKLLILVVAGLFFLMMLSCSDDNRNPTPTAQENPAKEDEANGQQYAPRIKVPDTTPQEAQLELLNRAAIELCKAETVKRQPNAKDYVANGHWFQVPQKNTFHVQVDWTLGGVGAAMVSDCRIARKDDKMTVNKIKFTFAN
jgi:hypothetical protein